MPKYNISLTSEKEINILRNQVWKLLPIIEGKDVSGKIVCDELTARNNFRKNLIILINKLLGASEIWFESQYWRDFLYQMQGLLAYDYPHDQVRQIVMYCTNELCEKMKEGIRSG